MSRFKGYAWGVLCGYVALGLAIIVYRAQEHSPQVQAVMRLAGWNAFVVTVMWALPLAAIFVLLLPDPVPEIPEIPFLTTEELLRQDDEETK